MEFSAASPIVADISPSFKDTSGFLFLISKAICLLNLIKIR